jgi:hypothetical protein
LGDRGFRGRGTTRRRGKRVFSSCGSARISTPALPCAIPQLLHRPQLHSKVDLDRSRADLHFLAHVIEAEHIGFHDPRPFAHLVDTESAIVVGHGEQNSLALGGLDGDAGNR